MECAVQHCDRLTPHALAQVFARRNFSLQSSTSNPLVHTSSNMSLCGSDGVERPGGSEVVGVQKNLIAPKFVLAAAKMDNTIFGLQSSVEVVSCVSNACAALSA